MRTTPNSNRLHIGIFGRRNAGKSSLINALTGQETAIVSEMPGTTTDPVHKAMEIHGIGPVVMIDTGGIDDGGAVGKRRVEKAYKVLDKTDICLLVIDKCNDFSEYEEKFLKEAQARNTSVIIVANKSDISGENRSFKSMAARKNIPMIEVSALYGTGMQQLRNKIVECIPNDFERKVILRDLLSPSDFVVMVAPLDMEAPKGRLKLPQVQAIRDILDSDCSVMVLKEKDLGKILSTPGFSPRLVITESQVLTSVGKIVPERIPLTTFSVLYARYKGELDILIKGAAGISSLKSESRVLIAEACTHHPIGDDVGQVIIPDLLTSGACGNKKIFIEHIRGCNFPADIKNYDLIIHCGGCMFNRKEMLSRINIAEKSGVPITNYGLFLAYMCGMLERVISPFTQAVPC